MKKIALFGIYPPPYGGRSIHIKRLENLLTNNGYYVDIYSDTGTRDKKNLRATRSIFYNIFLKKYDLLHFHDRKLKLIFVLSILAKIMKIKTVLTYHSFREDPDKYSLLNKIMFKYIVRNIDMFICVGPNEKNKLLNFVKKADKKVMLIPPYIKPEDLSEDYDKIPIEVWEFINESNFIISANGNIRFYNNEDLYGLDMLINLIEKLNENGIDARLIFALLGSDSLSREEENYFGDLRDRINEKKLLDKILIFKVEDSEFYPILKHTKLFIRPTNTDSFGISVAEALSLKIPALASDVCKRPPGTILFKSRSFSDLYIKVIGIYNNYSKCKNNLLTIDVEENGDLLLESYKKVFQEE